MIYKMTRNQVIAVNHRIRNQDSDLQLQEIEIDLIDSDASANSYKAAACDDVCNQQHRSAIWLRGR